MKRLLSLLPVLALLLCAGCQTDFSGGAYDAADAQHAMGVQSGVITRIANVKIQGESTGTGAVLGAIGGGLAGHAMASGGGKDGGAAIGAVLGGLLGAGVEAAHQNQKAVELEIALDGGAGSLVVVQTEGTDRFAVGMPVRVLTSSNKKVRVRPAN